MGYYIYAWLDNGNPQLQVVEAKSNAVCISWSYQASDNEVYERKEIQRLFRDLLLLTCKQEMGNCRVFTEQPVLG